MPEHATDSSSAQPIVPEPVTRKEIVTASVCRDCPWHRRGDGAVNAAIDHAYRTGHAVSAEHRERLLWDWPRRDV
jgi:hypothetical protein